MSSRLVVRDGRDMRRQGEDEQGAQGNRKTVLFINSVPYIPEETSVDNRCTRRTLDLDKSNVNVCCVDSTERTWLCHIPLAWETGLGPWAEWEKT